MSERDVARTDNELRGVKVLVAHSVVPRSHEHVLDATAGTLLTELHLENSVVDRLARDLPAQQVELAVRDFEDASRVAVLWSCIRTHREHRK